jgi:hypothetical protein
LTLRTGPAHTPEDLPGKWQAAILKAEQNRPKLRVIQQLIRPLSIGGHGVAARVAYEKRREVVGVGSSSQLRPRERATAPALRGAGG